MKNKIFKLLQQNWGLISIVILSVCLTFYRLAYQSYGFDEAYSIYITKDLLTMISNLWNHEANMWLYYAILYFWRVFGTSEFAVRALSAFFAIATIPVIYMLGNYVHSKRVALIASLLAAVNVAYIFYAQEARGYTLVLFLVSLSSYSYLRFEEDRRYKALFVISSALSVYTHFYAGLVFLAKMLAAFLGKKVKLITTAVLAVFLLITPIIFAPSIHSHQIDWILAPSLHNLVGTAFFLSGDFPPLFVLYGLIFVYSTPFFVKHYRDEAYGFLYIWLILPIIFSFAFSLLVKPIYQSTYFLICLPPFLLLAAISINRFKNSLLKIGLVLAILIFSIIRLSLLFSEDIKDKWVISNEKYDWRSAVGYISSNVQNADAVIVYPYQDKLLYTAYNPEGNQKVVEISSEPYLISGGKKLPEPNISGIESLKYPHVWLLLQVVKDEDFDHNKRQSDEIINALSKNYAIDSTKEYFGVELVHFNKK